MIISTSIEKLNFKPNQIYMMEQLTEEQAIEFAKRKVYEDWTDEQIVRFQLFQKKLCMDFGRFHQAIEKVLDRPVYTH